MKPFQAISFVGRESVDRKCTGTLFTKFAIMNTKKLKASNFNRLILLLIDEEHKNDFATKLVWIMEIVLDSQLWRKIHTFVKALINSSTAVNHDHILLYMVNFNPID